MKRLVKFIKLSAIEKIVFFQSIYYLVFFRIRLIGTSPQRLFALVSRRSVCSQAQIPSSLSSGRIAGIITAAGRIIPSSTCLSKGLAGFVLLARYGHKPRLHIGVSKDKELNLEAHAWLSLDGDIVLGSVPDLGRFREFPLDLVEDYL